MDNLEFIENYFKGNNDPAQKQDFEKKIMEDASFADDVAFYISANGLLQEQLYEEKKQRFKEMYAQGKVISMKPGVRSLWKYMAAASVIIAVILITWFLSGNKKSPQQLADTYIQQNFTTLPVTMGNMDSLQKGLKLFNNQQLAEAMMMFEKLASNDPSNDDAKKYAGIVSLRLHNYDKALEYFTKLEAETGLYSNPGKFYKAITLLERNKDDDKAAARLLLENVRDENLEGKNEAVEWLKKF